MEVVHENNNIYSYLLRPNSNGCLWMSDFSTTKTNAEALIRYYFSRGSFGRKLIILDPVSWKDQWLILSMCLPFLPTEPQPALSLGLIEFLFPQKWNVMWIWGPRDSKGDKGDHDNGIHCLHVTPSYLEAAILLKVLEQTAGATPKMVYLKGQYSARMGNYLPACSVHTVCIHAVCISESENSMWCYCSDRKYISARYQKLEKNMMPLTIILNGIP